MAETTPPGADVTPKKKRAPRKKKDPNAPAGVTSAYTFFFRARQATIKAQNPVSFLLCTTLDNVLS